MSNKIRIINLGCQGVVLFKLLELIKIKHCFKKDRKENLCQRWEQRTYVIEKNIINTYDNNSSFMIDEEWDYWININDHVIDITSSGIKILCNDNQREKILEWLKIYGIGLEYPC